MHSPKKARAAVGAQSWDPGWWQGVLPAAVCRDLESEVVAAACAYPGAHVGGAHTEGEEFCGDPAPLLACPLTISPYLSGGPRLIPIFPWLGHVTC